MTRCLSTHLWAQLLAASVLCTAPVALAAPGAKTKAKPAEAKPAPAPEPEPDPKDVYDVTKVQRPLLFTDGKGHYILAAKVKHDEAPLLYSSDGKTFYQQRVYSGGGSYDEKEGWSEVSWTFWEPRIESGWKHSFGWKDGKATLQCDDKATEFKIAPEEDSKRILATAKFRQAFWKRRAYKLARDREGTYFYIDNLREPANAKAFRLFAGRKGEVKQLALTNIVSDREGDIFSTKTGNLRLVLDKGESSWTVNGKTVQIVQLNLDENAKIIYSDLGMYGSTLGTPCDDLM